MTKPTLVERMAATAASARIHMHTLTDKQLREVERLAEQIQWDAMRVRVKRHVAASMGITDTDPSVADVLDPTSPHEGSTETLPAVMRGDLA